MQILLASNNPGKLQELRQLLSELEGLQALAPGDVGLMMEVAEVGATYAENASMKARAFAQASGLVTLADDSGLEVYALDGAPGLYSARYSPKPDATDADRRAYLLSQLNGLSRPWGARFRCVVAIAEPHPPVPSISQGAHYYQDEIQTAEGVCEGEIVPEERGENGFGYDPIFLLPELGKTMAELSDEQKNQVSHRARAVREAFPILKQLLRA